MKVVIEPEVAPHEATLYQSNQEAPSVDGFDAIDAHSLAFYNDQGYLLVRGGFSQDVVNDAKQTLHRMCLEDNPSCESVYYEGIIRQHLEQHADPSAVTGLEGSSDQLALGDACDNVPQLPAELRAKYVRKFMGFTGHYPALDVLAEHAGLCRTVSRLAA